VIGEKICCAESEMEAKKICILGLVVEGCCHERMISYSPQTTRSGREKKEEPKKQNYRQIKITKFKTETL
jgi:hypothetical protein